MNQDYYGKIEMDLVNLLRMTSWISQSDRDEVTHFINHGEYGLALESLVSAACDDEKNITDIHILEFKKVAIKMKKEHSPIITRYLQ